ncbi:OB-fold domain-containing protein [Mycolicibacterium sp. 120266]|uniref:Zn-ribbon domain-containing OB-fold protein n=1 Tax=Mycolicibacterium sp. 120266 TaxID=3090601 RepID=UPI00299CF4CB|nr:OB-fold domain-containing protein [Mycolicibacterium sp. 120266]MDX1873851.1 OB-fold domain-containing protein [Mycolicibacterium sp. 120266]
MDIRPGPDRPTPDVESEGWWQAVQDGQLLLNACRSCRRHHLYMRPFCPFCWSEDVAAVPSSGRGRLYTWSVIHQNAAPFDARTPYVVGMIDLDEGPRLMSTVEAPLSDLLAGMALVLAFRHEDDGFVVPIFRGS